LLPILYLFAFVLISCDSDPGGVSSEQLYLPEQDDRVLSIELVGDTLTIVYDCQALEVGIAPGQIVAGRGQGGFLRRVVTIELAGDTAVLYTAHATVAEAVGSGSMHEAIPLQGDWQLLDGGGTWPSSESLDLDGWAVFDGYTDAAELDVRIAEGSLAFDPVLVMDLEVADGQVLSFDYLVEGQLALDMTAEVSLAMGFSYTTERVVARYTRPLATAVGRCPLEGEVTVDLYAGIEISAAYDAAVQGTVQLDGTFEAGARFEDGQWAAVWDAVSVQGSDLTPEIEAEGLMSMRVWLRPQATATFFGRDGPTVGIEPFMGHEITEIAPPEWALTAGLNGAIAMDTGVFSPRMEPFVEDVTGDSEEVAVSDGSWVGYTAVDVGSTASCALDADGSLVCWGDPAVASAPSGEFKQVSVGHAHACALRADRGVTCWGEGLAVSGAPPMMTFSRITSGEDFSCGIHHDDGAAHCWGRDDHGQTTVPAGEFTEIAAGRFHACALDHVGRARCWGFGDDGQSEVPDGQFVEITAGFRSTCGLRAVGAVQCWGCAGGDDAGCDAPPGTYQSIDAGNEHACAIRDDDMVRCWGDSPSGATLPPPTASYLQVAAGFDHSCGLTAGGNAECWGDDTYGQSTPP